MTNSMFWVEHPEADQVMRKMFEDGCTMSQIGAAIGCSRNAVIGKVHRLGLDRGDVRRRAMPRARSPRPPQQQSHCPREGNSDRPGEYTGGTGVADCQPPRPEPQLEPSLPAAEYAKQITDLQHGECRWPVGEPGAGLCFCAEPQRWDSSYCAYHDHLSRERKRR